MAARAAGGPAALAVTAGRPSGYEPVHCWFGLPLQVHSSARAPSAVLASVTSRHRPDCTPVIVPLAFRDHCWLVPPLQGRMSTAVPGAVPCPEASRQSPPQYLSLIHISEPTRLGMISYAVFCLKKKK